MQLDINITISQENIKELICKYIKENGYIVNPDDIEFVIEKNMKGFPPLNHEVLELTSAKVKVDPNRKVKCLKCCPQQHSLLEDEVKNFIESLGFETKKIIAKYEGARDAERKNADKGWKASGIYIVIRGKNKSYKGFGWFRTKADLKPGEFMGNLK